MTMFEKPSREFQRVKVAVVQAEISPTLAEGLERTASLAREAVSSGAQIVVFPETWLPGYPASSSGLPGALAEEPCTIPFLSIVVVAASS